VKEYSTNKSPIIILIIQVIGRFSISPNHIVEFNICPVSSRHCHTTKIKETVASFKSYYSSSTFRGFLDAREKKNSVIDSIYIYTG
jgi:hypothetical protein